MSLERELAEGCPRCGETTVYRAASTQIHLGEKVKWRCTGEGCEYTFVRIDGAVDTATA
jgi:transposase-like protein